MNTTRSKLFILFLALAASLVSADIFAAKPVKITVTEAVPNEALQGDALPVRIKGTGFDPGSTVRFIVTDTRDDTQIEVGTVIYDSDTGDLVAHVKVKDQALVIDYDIEVKTSSGRRGKGTTLFRVRERAGQEDPCVTLETFEPDFVFYRDSWKGKNKGRTFYVAEPLHGCEKALFKFSADEGLVYGLSFSTTQENDSYLGRIIWKTGTSPDQSLWNYDFRITGTDLEHVSGPHRFMDNYADTSQKITNFDLSPDRQTLAYFFYVSYGEESVRIVDIDTCIASGCTFTPAHSLVLAEPYVPDGEYLESPAWGPLGERVYFRRFSRNEPEYSMLQYVDLPEGWRDAWPDPASFEPVETILVSTLEQPDFPMIYEIAGGVFGQSETLAIRVSSDGGCGYISLLDVVACETPESTCTVESVAFGRNPSWNRHGEVIYDYYSENATLCGSWGDTVGRFDGTGITTVLEGMMPDAAGGIPLE